MINVDWNIVFNIINVFVFYLLMRRFLFHPVNEMMEKRKAAVQASFDEVENKKCEAEKLKEEYERSLQNAQATTVAIINETKQRVSEEQTRLILLAKEESQKILENSRNTIELERRILVRQSQEAIAQMAILAAAKVIQKNMDETVNHKIIQDFLSEAGVGK